MRSLKGEKRGVFDPAPSRTAYRVQRLWLTPMFRSMLRTGLPVLSVLLLGFWYVSDETRIEDAKLSVTELRASIEHRPEFMVNLMRIEDVSAEVAEDIREVTSIDFPVSSFELDLKDMRVRIEELDAVARAELVVRAGGILDVEIEERIPAVIWRAREALEVLDAHGHRISALEARTSRSELPLIAGDGADKVVPEALELLSVAAPVAARVRGLLRVGDRRWDLILSNNQRIMLPETGAIAALETALAMNETNDLLARDLVAIDLRDPRRPTLRLTDQAVEFLRNINTLGHGASDKDDGL